MRQRISQCATKFLQSYENNAYKVAKNGMRVVGLSGGFLGTYEGSKDYINEDNQSILYVPLFTALGFCSGSCIGFAGGLLYPFTTAIALSSLPAYCIKHYNRNLKENK